MMEPRYVVMPAAVVVLLIAIWKQIKRSGT